MAVSILNIDDFESDDFNIIAIHTSLEAYKLAYQINKHCQISLALEPTPLTLSKFDINTSFDFFKYEDNDQRVIWSLISNKSIISSTCHYTDNLGWIETNIYSDIILIPECQAINFFIKIEESVAPEHLNSILNDLKKINDIEAIYEINKNTLVSIKNLLF
jgi:hypothetical protein